MTKAIYTATAEHILKMAQRPVKHRVSVSGVLKRLGVSRPVITHGKKDALLLLKNIVQRSKKKF